MRGTATSIADGERVGTAFAHPSTLRFLEFSVKVVRHRIGKSFCGRLWETNGWMLIPQPIPTPAEGKPYWATCAVTFCAVCLTTQLV